MGGDFELTRQDGRDMALSELGANQYWITFMEPTCQAVRQNWLECINWVWLGSWSSYRRIRTWIRPSWAVGFSEARLMRCPLAATPDLARVIARYRLPAVPTNKAWTTPFGGINPKPMAS